MRGRNVLNRQRQRRVPPQFSWVDHRLVRDGHVQGRSAEALALYLFLVTVADAQGLSWYSEVALCRHLAWTPERLAQARRELCEAALVAYCKPLYQVLDLAPEAILSGAGERTSKGAVVSFGDILQGLLAPTGTPRGGQP